jgi:hypothetical protein
MLTAIELRGVDLDAHLLAQRFPRDGLHSANTEVVSGDLFSL